MSAQNQNSNTGVQTRPIFKLYLKLIENEFEEKWHLKNEAFAK